jgi:hypothetical protein
MLLLYKMFYRLNAGALPHIQQELQIFTLRWQIIATVSKKEPPLFPVALPPSARGSSTTRVYTHAPYRTEDVLLEDQEERIDQGEANTVFQPHESSFW